MAARHQYTLDRVLGLQLWTADLRSDEIARRLNTTRFALYRLAHKCGWPKRTTGRRSDTPKPDNRQRCAAAAQRQLDRCERILAAEVQPPPRWTRCPICQGRQWSEQPHQHGDAA